VRSVRRVSNQTGKLLGVTRSAQKNGVGRLHNPMEVGRDEGERRETMGEGCGLRRFVWADRAAGVLTDQRGNKRATGGDGNEDFLTNPPHLAEKKGSF